MIRSLQKKFIIVALISVAVVITTVLGILYLYFHIGTYNRIFGMIDFIAKNNGEMPLAISEEPPGDIDLTEESPYFTRYYTVEVDKNDKISYYNLDHIAAVNGEDAGEFAQLIRSKGNVKGFIKQDDIFYAYKATVRSDGGAIIVFLDCTENILYLKRLMQNSILLGVVCVLFFFLVISAVSKRAIKPMIDNIQRQEEFITNAGHEIKTPLAIISANTEYLEMIQGENQWTKSTLNQTQRLTVLVNKLIRLTKLGEEDSSARSDVDVSSVVSESVKAFEVLAQKEEKKLSSDIEEGIVLSAVKEDINEIASILTDNAVKYCDEGGNISVSLKKNTFSGFTLEVSNTYKDGKDIDYEKFFDRFYREDHSHNSKKQGYGIGLSMLKAYAEKYKGKITVSYKDESIKFKFTV